MYSVRIVIVGRSRGVWKNNCCLMSMSQTVLRSNDTRLGGSQSRAVVGLLRAQVPAADCCHVDWAKSLGRSAERANGTEGLVSLDFRKGRAGEGEACIGLYWVQYESICEALSLIHI